MLKTSAFSGRGHIPPPHPPPMASKAGHVWLRHGPLLLHHLHPPYQNPGYTPDGGGWVMGFRFICTQYMH